MKLYIAKIQRTTTHTDWVEPKYVVAETYAQVEEEFPKALEIILVTSDLTIVSKKELEV